MNYIEQFLRNKNAHVYIWGMGRTGVSALKFFKTYHPHLTITCVDKNNSISKEKNTSYIEEKFFLNTLDSIIENQDIYFVISPGIKIPYEIKYHPRIISELDLFYALWGKKIIAITGSAGKTSTTTLLYQSLSNNYKCILGGNIGIPLFDIIPEEQNNYDFAILEVSSAQLINTKLFNPTYVLWTNIFYNHLDYHNSFDEYYNAKKKCITNNDGQNTEKIFLSDQLIPLIEDDKELVNHKKKLYICSYGSNKYFNNNTIHKKYNFITYNNNTIYCNNYPLGEVVFPEISYPQNWILIFAVLYELNIEWSKIFKNNNFSIPLNRLEYIGTINQRVFFNDSKATIMESVICGYNHIRKKSPEQKIFLLIGGLGKGIDRSEFITKLLHEDQLLSIIIFGNESQLLYNKIKNNSIFKTNTLKEAITITKNLSSPNDIIILAPGGSSFDQFNSYEERGDVFKKNINEIFSE